MRRQLLGQLLRITQPDLSACWPGGVFNERKAADAVGAWERGRTLDEVVDLIRRADELQQVDPVSFDSPPPPPRYFAFVDRSLGLGRVHRADCAYCSRARDVRHGARTMGRWWQGPFSSFDAVRSYTLRHVPSARDCTRCFQGPASKPPPRPDPFDDDLLDLDLDAPMRDPVKAIRIPPDVERALREAKARRIPPDLLEAQ